MIAVIDYGMGNLGSIRNMFSRIGIASVVTSSSDDIERAEKLVLPGVGSFDQAMDSLERLGLALVLNKLVIERRKPILGICLGMQLMSTRSEEGTKNGFGWLNAETVRFRFTDHTSSYRVPHMGWNSLDIIRPNWLFSSQPYDARYYFVHSYHVQCRTEENVIAKTTYGMAFHSAIVRENIVGLQFHPEKSHKFGMKVLQRFAHNSP